MELFAIPFMFLIPSPLYFCLSQLYVQVVLVTRSDDAVVV